MVFIYVRPLCAQSNRWKSVTCPSNGKCIAKSKGVHREVESGESWRQNFGLMNRNHIRLQLGIRLHNKLKSNNYPGLASYCRLHLTTINSVSLDTQHSQSFIWKHVKTNEPLYTEPYVRWCGRPVDKIIIYLLPGFGIIL